MKSYNIYEAKTKLSQLVNRARQGEEITIARHGKPQVRLVPVEEGTEKKIIFGGMRGQIKIRKGFDDVPPEFEPYT